MTRVTIAMQLLAALFVAATVEAQPAPAPEQCLAGAGDRSSIIVTHGNKTYRMANEACRDQFQSDPELFAQLYDALLELEAEGVALQPAAPSLVPS